MKKYYLFAGLVLLAASPSFAQTKIGGTGAPDGSAMLEVTSGATNNKGLLLPRMTTVQRNAITAPATGLMIYNTTANQVQVNTGTPAAPIWEVATAANSGWDLTGNSGTNPATNFIGTTDNQSLAVRTNNTEKMRVTSAGNVGIGNTAPIFTLDVGGGIRLQRDTLVASNSGASILWNSVNSGGGETELINYRGTGGGGFRFYNLAPGITPGSAVGDLMRITGAGDVGIGTSAPAQTLHVEGTARIATATGTPTTITGRNATGDVGNVTLGSGLSLTGGVLNTTADNADWNLTGNTGTNPATNFIGTGDAQPLAIRTNNTEKVRVTAAGNMGIGTTSPTQKLQVTDTGDASIAITASAGRQMRVLFGSENHGVMRNLTSSGGNVNDVALYTSSGIGLADLHLVANSAVTGSDSLPLDQFVLKNSGNVGIGTNAPTRKLHVEGTARIATAVGTPTTITGRDADGDVGNVIIGSGLAFSGGTLSATTTTDNTDWNLTGNAGTSPATNFIGTSDAQPLVIRTDNTEQVRVTAAGNVGIGTTAPTQTLDIVGTARIRNATGTPTTIAGRNNNGDVGAVTLGSGLSLTAGVLNTTADNADWNLTGNTGTNPATNFMGTSDNQPLVVRTNNTEKVRVTTAGNVGIGTATPAFTLDVSGGIKASSDVLTASNFGSAMVWNSVNSGQGETELINYRGNGGGGFRFSTAAPGVVPAAGVGELMRITGAGDVGIGTATPAQTLHVAGTARISTATGTPTTITGRNAAGDVGNVTVGSGLSLTGGVLSVPPAPVQLVLGTVSGAVDITASTTGWLYAGCTITLPANSTYKVTADMILNIAPTNTAGTYIVPAGQSLWIRSTFADSPTGGPSADLIGSNLISGTISTGMTRNMLHGAVTLSNTTNAPKTYYYIAGNVETYGFTPTVYAFGSGAAGENQIYAIPIN